MDRKLSPSNSAKKKVNSNLIGNRESPENIRKDAGDPLLSCNSKIKCGKIYSKNKETPNTSPDCGDTSKNKFKEIDNTKETIKVSKVDVCTNYVANIKTEPQKSNINHYKFTNSKQNHGYLFKNEVDIKTDKYFNSAHRRQEYSNQRRNLLETFKINVDLAKQKPKISLNDKENKHSPDKNDTQTLNVSSNGMIETVLADDGSKINTEDENKHIKTKSLIVNIPVPVNINKVHSGDSNVDIGLELKLPDDDDKKKIINDKINTHNKQTNFTHNEPQKRITKTLTVKNLRFPSSDKIEEIEISKKNKTTSLNRKSTNASFTKEKTSKSNRKSKRHKCTNKRFPFPELSMENIDSSNTEAVKWAPNSINKHTKQYYEAWVNTTLAAVPKNDNLIDKRNIIQSFQRGLEQLSNSSVIYDEYEDYTDNRFIGKIKVNHR